ncbi:MAG: GNAT family N-acetyltransferase [Sphingobacteriia bacterium]|jgi:hypothetical protein
MPHSGPKAAYAALVQPDTLLFMQPRWLDAVCQWEAVVAKDKGGMAGLAVPRMRRWGLSQADRPPFTPYLAPVFQPADGTEASRASRRQAQLVLQLLSQLPPRARYQFLLPPGMPGLAFHHAGFGLHTRYTYRLSLQVPEAQLWSQLKSELRTQIRKAERQHLLLNVEPNLADFGALLQASDNAVAEKARALLPARVLALPGVHRLLMAYDALGTPTACVLLVHDAHTVYLNYSCIRSARQDTGVNAWLHWQAIRWAQAAGYAYFDFEGSMLPAVGRFYAQFGGELCPYLLATRAAHPLMRLRQALAILGV